MSDEVDRKFQKELNSGVIALVLLALIQERGEAMYGYEIAKGLAARTSGPLPMHESAIYPVLRSLEQQGLLTSVMQRSASGPPRKYYQITALGRKSLGSWREAWTATSQFVEQFLESQDDRKSRNGRSVKSSGPGA